MKKLLISLLTVVSIGLTTWSCSEYDDSGIRKEISDIKDQISKLNGEVNSLKAIVEAASNGKVITDVKATATGYDITFSDGKTITVTHGTNGTNAPVIGVKEDNGIYYWTLTTDGKTDFLYDAQKPDQKIPVSGKDGEAPNLTVDADGYWTIDGTRITDAGGNEVKAAGTNGDSFFKKIEVSDDTVTFTLADGTKITLPRTEALNITIGATGELFVKFGATKEFDITLSGIESYTIAKPDGWKAAIKDLKLQITAPVENNNYAEQFGTISIIGVGKNATFIASMDVTTGLYQLIPMDIEAATLSPATFSNSIYGENLYSATSAKPKYTGYHDTATDLEVAMNSTDFWSGGLVPSIYNNMEMEGFQNQCSVFYKDPATGFGGYAGSKAFIVAYCSTMGGGTSKMNFKTADKEAVIDHAYITNNTYAYFSLLKGDGFAHAHTYENKDWFKVTFVGYDKADVKTGEVELYLSDFRTPTSPGILTDWTKVDLSSLGKVHKITFVMSSTDGDGYWMNTPAYFCMDNIVVRGE